MVSEERTEVRRTPTPRSRFGWARARALWSPLHGFTAPALLALVVACASAPPPLVAAGEVRQSANTSDLQLLWPLEDGTVFSYRTIAENTGEAGLLVMSVARPSPGRVELTVAGRRRRLELSGDAIRLASGGTALKSPLKVGKEWRGAAGPVRVTGDAAAVTVPAGTFEGCLITEESSSSGSQTTTTTYCPGVGIVKLEVEAQTEQGYARELAELEAWGPGVDWGQDGVTVIREP